MLLTENNIGYFKRRSVLNGKNSRVWANKEETYSPTSVNESIMITASIDDKYGIYLMV